MKKSKIITAVFAASLVFCANASADKPVGITKDIMDVTVKHDGKEVKITRNQDNKNTVNPAFAKTSRPCPPFCIQPAVVAPGVETIAEIEMLDYLSRMSAGDDTILVIDSRTPDWVKKGTIPGARNIPWTSLNPVKGADPISILEIMENEFGVKENDDSLDFTNAKTVVMFCNGMWCGQSPNNIRNLLKLGYPADKIKWYRGGMQDWEILGLTTVPGK
ncbi:MAG: rhodanese-like domain-containing protein [Gammaproteobacteria bacterium]|nr:rhodanese-like domain-containing protein [Gammaproteobacteria bacterium]